MGKLELLYLWCGLLCLFVFIASAEPSKAVAVQLSFAGNQCSVMSVQVYI